MRLMDYGDRSSFGMILAENSNVYGTTDVNVAELCAAPSKQHPDSPPSHRFTPTIYWRVRSYRYLNLA